jgi:hypothetical protein
MAAEIRPGMLSALRGDGSQTTLVVDELTADPRRRLVALSPVERRDTNPELLGAQRTTGFPVLHEAHIVDWIGGLPVWGVPGETSPSWDPGPFAGSRNVTPEMVAFFYRCRAIRLAHEEFNGKPPAWAPVALDNYAGIALGGDHPGVAAESPSSANVINHPSKYGWVDLNQVADGRSVWTVEHHSLPGWLGRSRSAVWVWTRRGELFELTYLHSYAPLGDGLVCVNVTRG